MSAATPAIDHMRQGAIDALARIIDAAGPDPGRTACVVIHIRNMRKVRGLLGEGGAAAFRDALRRRLERIPASPEHVIDGNDDHFILVLPRVMNTGHAELAAQKIELVLRETSVVEQQPVEADFTLGLALFPDHADEPGQLLARAELALVAAEHADRSRAMFDDALYREMSHSWQFNRELREAIQTNAFTICYQPQVGLADGEIQGVEALVRWEHPLRGVIQPSLFIPVAEQAGLIGRLTDGVLKRVLQDVSTLRKLGIPAVSINLSALDLEDPELAARVGQQLAIWGVPGEHITFEITESSLLEGSEVTRAQLARLHELGCGLSIDDFGTGYSSLANFKTVPASEIKIDGSFVANLETERADRDIVAIALELGRRFGLKTVAEGVETKAAATALAEMGCQIGQGYYFSRPLTLAQLQTWRPRRPE
ncbi:MAG TPA: GGDEF domain-containing protein [Thioalkalivibrio sp.]|nr:GGDEF domain-containing protein [Thioalkalivibrio sp.]